MSGRGRARQGLKDELRHVTQDAPVLIAGGGIAGLTLALALAQRGVASQVIERRAQFSVEGAGIQLGPNATGVLRRLGVAAILEASAGWPRSLRVRSGVTGSAIAELPLGEWITSRHGAPYWSVHRADLQAALLAVARGRALIELQTGAELSGFEILSGGVTAAAGGAKLTARALVGADGLRSRVRRLLWPDFRLEYSGRAAVRTLVPARLVSEIFREPEVGAWLAPFGHIVHYPIRQGAEIAVTAILDQDWPGLGWSIDARPEDLAASLDPFPDQLKAFLAGAGPWRKWALYDAPPLPRWSSGPVTLLGDAAHPVLPFLAQGGALAIEDAETLAACFATWRDPVEACRRYERLRMARARRIQSTSRRNGQIYRLAGPAAAARNLTMRAVPGPALMTLYDWVYGWNGDTIDGTL